MIANLFCYFFSLLVYYLVYNLQSTMGSSFSMIDGPDSLLKAESQFEFYKDMQRDNHKRSKYLDKRLKEKATCLKVVADKDLAEADAKTKAANSAMARANAELNLTFHQDTAASNEA